MNWIEAKSKLGGRTSRKVGNNTYLELDEVNESTVHLKLHSTRIISWNEDGTIRINSGGWQTVTTKARLNEYLDGVEVLQKKHEWFVLINDQKISFEDGMTLPTCK